jgi:hypothetical protein
MTTPAARPTATRPTQTTTPTPISRSGARTAFLTSAGMAGVLASVSLAAVLPLPAAVALGLLVGVFVEVHQQVAGGLGHPGAGGVGGYAG